MIYPLFRWLARVMLRVFFRRIEVEGRARVPLAGPLLLVPNHANALVDPLLLVTTLRRRVTMTAKNVLGKNPVLGMLLSGLGTVTFHRSQDVGKGAHRRQNVSAVMRCRQVLAEGGALCIFPEGVSHSDPHLRPFQSGAAHVALDYARKDGNPGRLKIVPVGLLYTEKDRFRSAVWLRYGDPLDVADWLSEHPQATGHTLTEELCHRVDDITLNYENRRENLILVWAADVLATQGLSPPPLGWSEKPVARWFELIRRLRDGHRRLQASHSETVEALTARIRRYRSELKRLDIEPGEVYLPFNFGKASFFVFREIELLLIGAPIALYGAIHHIGPYVVVRAVAKKWSTDKDHWATNVVYPSFLAFPFFYLLQIGAAFLFLPPLWALLYAVSLPYSAAVALLYGDRLKASWRRLRTFWYFLRHRRQREQLVKEGQEIIASVRALGEKLNHDG